MTGLEIAAAIAAAFKIVKEARGAFKAIQELGTSVGLLEKEVEQPPPPVEIDETQPAGIITKGLFDELADLSKDYHKKSGTWKQNEREAHQKVIAAKACELLKNGEDFLKGIVKSFDTVKKFFCKVADEAV